MSKMKIVLLGAPGSGKGAQAEKMVLEYGIPVIGTGNILREEIKKFSQLGLEAKKFMDAGHLVPDGVILGIVRERLKQPDCRKGYILDGVPRTIAQAEALEKITKIDYVIDLEVDDKIIIERLIGRRYCGSCMSVYHIITAPPKKTGICDKCGSQLLQRDDDKPEAVKRRLQEYNSKTRPLKEFYKQKGILRQINGAQSIDMVFADIGKVISTHKQY